jgi:cobalt-zinc-cadmium resistance protein CzcA
MLDRILAYCLKHRWLMLALVVGASALGIYNYERLPIDAVPDITNVQVQINTQAPGYSPVEAEQRITYLVETALTGIPRLDYTRSISRYGLSQVTAVFEDGTDIYFARQLIGERLVEVKTLLPPDIRCICVRSRTGSCGRSSGKRPAWSKSTRPAAISSSFTFCQTRWRCAPTT